MNTLEYSFPHYLAAKKSVDDRALNRSLWESFGKVLAAQSSLIPIKILEIGAGTGVMVERMLEAGLLRNAHYTLLDAEAENNRYAQQRLRTWAERHGYCLTESGPELSIQDDSHRITIRFETADVFQFVAQERGRQAWDVLVAHAFLDLVDLSSALPQIFSLLKEAGWFYFTINFDGLTVLEPIIFPEFDAQVVQLYHRSMDTRLTNNRPAGDSRTGRRLFTALPQAGGQILAAGASDWVVFPQQGVYPADEAYFLHFIVHFIDTALSSDAGLSSVSVSRGQPALDPLRFAAWIAERQAQIERGELVFIAHQIDFLGQYRNP